jgi:hypothetical protein
MVRRAQVKIQQMAFMLIAITIFFVLVGMFVLVIKFNSLKGVATELEEKNALLLVTKLANSPEFSCGQGFGKDRLNCVDADKVMMLKKRINEYGKFWGVSNIEIRKIYPPSNQDLLCDFGNYPECNVIRLIGEEVSGYGIGNYVSLCRKEYFEEEVVDRCEIAELSVSYEEK